MKHSAHLRQPWIIALVPFTLGLTVAALLALGGLAGTAISVRAQLNALSVYTGLLLSLLIALGLGLRASAERRCARRMSQLQSQTVDEQRGLIERAAHDRHRLLNNLYHELGSPVSAIDFAVANLESALAERQDRVANLKTVAIRLQHVVAGTRKLYETETKSLSPGRVDVAALLREVMAVAQEHAENTNRQLRLIVHQAPGPLPSVTGDEELLFMAVDNLLDNALKFTRPGDSVEVEAFEDGTDVVIRVADTGPGILDTEIESVWDEYYRGKETKGLVPGSGLGLPLVRAVVTRHRGQVSLSSRVGKGTIVTIRLPIDDVALSALVLAAYQAWHGLPSHRTPAPYDSTDPNIIAQHIQAAKAQGIHGFVVDWYGQPAQAPNDADRAFIDRATAELIRQSSEKDFQIAIMYDQGTLAASGRPTTTYTDQAIRDLQYATRYLSLPGYLKFQGKPVIFVFDYGHVEPYLQWPNIRAQLGIDVLLLDKDPDPLSPAHDAHFDGHYAWVQPTTPPGWQPDGAEWGEGYLRWFYATMAHPAYTGKIMVGGVWPGFDDSGAAWGSGRYIGRRCGATWRNTWRLVEEHRPPLVLIATYNDFEEGTAIEQGVGTCLGDSRVLKHPRGDQKRERYPEHVLRFTERRSRTSGVRKVERPVDIGSICVRKEPGPCTR